MDSRDTTDRQCRNSALNDCGLRDGHGGVCIPRDRLPTVERKPWREEPESCSWRAEGRSLYAVQPGRAYYQSDHDMFLGVLDTTVLAEAAARDHNASHGLGLPKYGDTEWTGKSRVES